MGIRSFHSFNPSDIMSNGPSAGKLNVDKLDIILVGLSGGKLIGRSCLSI